MDLKPQFCQPLWITEDLYIRTLKKRMYKHYFFDFQHQKQETPLRWFAVVGRSKPGSSANISTNRNMNWTLRWKVSIWVKVWRPCWRSSNTRGITPSLALWMGLAGACHPSDPSAGASVKVILSLHQPNRATKASPSPRAVINFTRSSPAHQGSWTMALTCWANLFYHCCQTSTHAAQDSPNLPNYLRDHCWRLRLDASPHEPICSLTHATLQNLMEPPASPNQAMQDPRRVWVPAAGLVWGLYTFAGL